MYPQALLGVLIDRHSKTEKENLNSEITWLPRAPEGSCCPVLVLMGVPASGSPTVSDLCLWVCNQFLLL